MTSPEDRELIRRCIDGEEEAWKTLVRRTHRAVADSASYLLRRYGFPPSEDSVREVSAMVYARLWQHRERDLGRIDGTCSLPVGLAVLSRGETLRWIQRRTRSAERELPLEETDPPSRSPSPAARLEQEDRRRLVEQALAELLPDERELAVELYDREQSTRALARRLGLPRNTLTHRIARLKAKLAEFFKNHLSLLI